MATASSKHVTLANHQLAIVWGAWVELGVSGWQRTHSDWTIDPEPLVIATAGLRDTDPRLRDESLDWCIHNWRYLSRVRLRNLIRYETDDVREAWGPFAATVSHHAGIAPWPGATERFRYKITGRSSFDSLEQPSRAWVRLRGMFGLGARTEIIRFFLTNRRRASVAVIAEMVGYAKRNVAEECDALAKAGVLRTQQVANRFYYSLARRSALMDFVGDIAPVSPDWSSLFAVTNALVTLEEMSSDLSHAALLVESHRVRQAIRDDLDRLDIVDDPTPSTRDDYWPAMQSFGRRYLGAWADGAWEPAELKTASPVAQRRSDASRRRLAAVEPRSG